MRIYEREHPRPPRTRRTIRDQKSQNPSKRRNRAIHRKTVKRGGDIPAQRRRQRARLEADGRRAGIPYYRTMLRIWRKIVVGDDPACHICGARKADGAAITAHHIFFRSKYPELSCNIANGIPLCKACHYEVHHPQNTSINYIPNPEPSPAARMSPVVLVVGRAGIKIPE